jgi:predicted AlkP superfamily phosphohydrolase/phosphomutase
MSKGNLIVGLDGGTWTVLRPAMEEGYMPFLKSLVDEGASGVLESTTPAITPAAWGTFQTGRNPGANGVYNFSYWDRKSKSYLPIDSTNLQQTIWQIVSKAGRQVVALNVPMTYPPQPVNGHIVSGILTPSLESPFTYPVEFREELLSQFPGYHVLNLKNIPKKGPDNEVIKAFIENLVIMISTRADVACYLLDKGAQDLFMVHFQAPDVLQHLLWKHLDPEHPDHDGSMRNYIFSTFYRHLDKQIERIFKLFKKKNPNSMVMIASDHGFESHFRRFNIGNWLHQNGYLKLNQTMFRNFKTKQVMDRIYNSLEKVLPKKVKVELRKLLISQQALINWPDTKAFAVCSGGEGCIYLLEEDESAKKQTAAAIKEKLLKETDPLNSSPIAKKVHLRDELYSGERKHFLPDMIIEPTDTYSFTGPYQKNNELFTSVGSDSVIQLGKHHKEGIIIASGEGIKPNPSLYLKLIDIVPTLLYYMGIRSPVFLEGTVCQDLFKQSLIETTPALQIGTEKNKGDRVQENVYSDHEQDLIQQRLKNLGYLE